MNNKDFLTFFYDKEADYLMVNFKERHSSQESEEVEEGIFALINSKTENVEGYQILRFKKRFSDNFEFKLPLSLKLENKVG